MFQEGHAQLGFAKPPSALPPVIQEFLLGYCKSKILFAAIRLRIFDALAGRPSTAEELAGYLGFSEQAGERFLVACTSLGLTHWDGQRYHNTELATKYFLTGTEESVVPIALHADSVQYPLWQFLCEGVQENHTQCYRAFNRDEPLLAGDLYKNEHVARRFLGAMHWRSSAACRVELDNLDLSTTRHLLDIGGGTGAFCIEAVRRYPHLTATILELPHICPITQEYIQRAEVQGKIKVIPGDAFTTPLPEAQDAVVVTLFLHDWPEEKQRILLRKITGALARGGKCIIAERFMPDDKQGVLPAIFMDLNMLLATGGIEHSANQWITLLKQSGFRETQAIALPQSSRDLLIATAP